MIKNSLYAILFVLAALLIKGCRSGKTILTKLDCEVIHGLNPFLVSGQIILLGELHGTQEAPYYVEQVVCHALKKNLKVTVGLELLHEDEEVVRNYLESAGSREDQNSILNLHFWAREYQDGRASQAMFGLIEAIRILKSRNQDVDIILIDRPEKSDRDLEMARRIIRSVEEDSSRLHIVLTGNYHNMIFEDSEQMGGFVLRYFGSDKVISLNQGFSAGSAWLDVAGEGFGPIGVRGEGRSKIGIFLDAEPADYHGTFEMDSIHYSRPAKELLRGQ